MIPLNLWSNKLHMQETVAEAFVRCFQLTPEEVAIIKGSSRESPITPEFFTVLDKTQKIRSNTKYLLQVSNTLWSMTVSCNNKYEKLETCTSLSFTVVLIPPLPGTVVSELNVMWGLCLTWLFLFECQYCANYLLISTVQTIYAWNTPNCWKRNDIDLRQQQVTALFP